MIDFRILELLASKICHDLISPIGAINNGIELIEDIGGSVVDDAMKLIAASAAQASKKLRLFRMAYGRAGGETGVTAKDIRTAARDCVGLGKSTLAWGDEHSLTALANMPGGLKTLLNMVMLADDMLSHGGTITVEPLLQGAGEGVGVTVSGRNARLSEAALEALSLRVDIEGITPRTVHAYVLGLIAEHYGLTLSHQQVAEEKLSLILMASAPAAG